MSYGQNQPQGLQATKTLNSATYNGATSPYLIPSGYAQYIYQGDLVVFDYTTGYITALIPDPAASTLSTYARIGVFAGCSYQTTTATNPIDPASPGRPFWPAGTVTLGAMPAIAMIIDDPMVVYNIQTNSTPGLTQANMGSTYEVTWPTLPTVAPFLIPGNQSTGQSSMALLQTNPGGASATQSLRARNLVAIPGNVSGLGYNNAEVIIQFHLYCSRPTQ